MWEDLRTIALLMIGAVSVFNAVRSCLNAVQLRRVSNAVDVVQGQTNGIQERIAAMRAEDADRQREAARVVALAADRAAALVRVPVEASIPAASSPNESAAPKEGK